MSSATKSKTETLIKSSSNCTGPQNPFPESLASTSAIEERHYCVMHGPAEMALNWSGSPVMSRNRDITPAFSASLLSPLSIGTRLVAFRQEMAETFRLFTSGWGRDLTSSGGELVWQAPLAIKVCLLI
ncbi:hypothetical protein BaRGS_00011197 [Batillaria attramentaria]|uniref:Uncharacterized protein n=1 Tax=Batillaria attramentaria TaxID=370345 RepID=A0ABD0LE13_9CAEN